MFLIKEREYPIINSKYLISNAGEIYNNTFDGGEQIYLDRIDRHIFIDMNSSTLECYGINVIIEAFKFSTINFNLKPHKDISLYFKKSDNYNNLFILDEFKLKSYVDYKNRLVMFGDVKAKGDCYQFFKDTYCVFSNQKVGLIILKVDDEILNYIKIRNL